MLIITRCFLGQRLFLEDCANANKHSLMKRSLFRIFVMLGSFAFASCSWHLLGHSKNGTYQGMSGTTQGMSSNMYVPPQVQRQEPLF